MDYFKSHTVQLDGYKSIMDAMNTTSIEIYVQGNKTYHQLDAGFIPVDNVSITIGSNGKLQSSGSSNWEAREGEPGYIANRTHYKDSVSILEEEHQYDPETGEGGTRGIYIEHNFGDNSQAAPNCRGWECEYYNDSQDPVIEANEEKIVAFMDQLREYPEGTVFTIKMNIYDANIGKSFELSENVKLHKPTYEESDADSGFHYFVEYTELYPDYFWEEIPYDEGQGTYGPFSGPGFYVGAYYSTEEYSGQNEIMNNARLDVCLHEAYYMQEIVDREFEGDSDENYKFNVKASQDTIVKLGKEYIPQMADWNVNDSSSVDYIKNRTHYKVEDKQEPVGFYMLDGGSEEQAQTTSGHDFIAYYLQEYLYEDTSGEGDNTLWEDLRNTFVALDTAWSLGIRKINIRLDDYDNEIFTCNLFRTYDDSHSHVRYITYTLSLDEAETVEDIDNIFNTDEDTQGNPVESKGVLFKIYCCDQDLV